MSENWPGSPVEEEWPGTPHEEPVSGTWDFLRSIPRGMVKGFTSSAMGGDPDVLAAQVGMGQTPEDIINTQKGVQKELPAAIEKLPLPHAAGPAGQYGETLGEFLGNPTTYVGPGGLAAKAVTAASGALGSEAAGQFTKGSALEPWARFGGAVAGGHAVTAVPHAVTPNIISPERQALIDTLHGEGVTGMTAGQRTGSKPLRWAESTLADVPFSGTSAADLNEANAGQYTRAALRRVGENSERATPDVVDRAFDHSERQLNHILQNSQIHVDAQLGNDVTGTAQQYTGTPGLYNHETQNAVTGAIQRIHDLFVNNNGTISGGQYQTLRSDLSRAARGSTDPQRSQALREVIEHLDDALERSSGAHTADAFRDWRQQYRNLLVIERAATSAGGEQAGQGFISPAQLGTATRGVMGRRAYARGHDEFSGLARAGQAILTPLPQSGTAPRENIMHHLQLAGLLGGAGFLAGEAPGAAAGAAAGIATPAIAARALMSSPVQNYLSNNTAWQRNLQRVMPARMHTSPAIIATINALRGGQ